MISTLEEPTTSEFLQAYSTMASFTDVVGAAIVGCGAEKSDAEQRPATTIAFDDCSAFRSADRRLGGSE